jgi:hypothetical protein
VTIVVTSETGGTAQSAEAVYVPPDLQVQDGGSTTVLAEMGLAAAFVADLLSACLAHERCGVHLYRSIAGRTADAELRVQYEHFAPKPASTSSGSSELWPNSAIDSAGRSPQR